MKKGKVRKSLMASNFSLIVIHSILGYIKRHWIYLIKSVREVFQSRVIFDFFSSCALVCQWDKPPDSNNSGSLIPGTVSKWTSASTPSSVKSAKYYYEKSIEEIVNVASLQNKLENLRKQYRKLRKLKLSRLNESKIDNETPSIAGKGDPKSYEEVEVHPPTISLSGDLLSGIKSWRFCS